MFKNCLNAVSLLKLLMGAIFVTMIGIAIGTSLSSDIFHLPAAVVTEPWFTTTLTDFYFNILIISVWVIYRENHWLRSLFWIIAFILLGSIATALYVLLQLLSLKPGQGLESVLQRKQSFTDERKV